MNDARASRTLGNMWVRGAAIRPVPAFAVVHNEMLDDVESDLARGGEVVRSDLDQAFERFENTQPIVSDYIADVLSGPLDETALALGYFLSVAVWLAFDRSFGARLGIVTEDVLADTVASVRAEEELRRDRAAEPLDVDDIIAIEQPHILKFVHAHVEAALEVDADATNEVDVDDVHYVYRAILVLTLAMSRAVAHPAGFDTRLLSCVS